MRILLLSAYDATSHRQWYSGLKENLSEHIWTILTLEPRYFSWRVRGNAFSWFSEQYPLLNGNFDLILATSMVDLATLRGLIPKLATIPTILYFHENQFAYPASGREHTSIEGEITSIYSALAADLLCFNSAYNRDSFFKGAEKLLRRMPDHAPLQPLAELKSRAQLLPVPIDDVCFSTLKQQRQGAVQLIWNHRWEFDKGPMQLLLLLEALERQSLDFRIHIIGQQFRNQPPEFEKIRVTFAHRIESWGFIEHRDDYLQLLRESDIAISTALHDFQGLAILEAAACGVVPVAPERLAYPELFGKENLYASSPENPEAEAEAAAGRIITIASDPEHYKCDPSNLAWRRMKGRYRALIDEATDR